MKAGQILLILIISILINLAVFANFSSAANPSSNTLINNITVSPLGLNNTTYIFSKLNISINLPIPKTEVSIAPTINNTDDIPNTQCTTKITYSQQPSINKTETISQINKSLIGLQTGITVYSSQKYNATIPNYIYDFNYTVTKPGIYTVMASCPTILLNYTYNKTNNSFTATNISSFNISAVAFKQINVNETQANITQYGAPIFNSTVIMPGYGTITIINNTLLGHWILEELNISSNSSQNITTHIFVSNAINAPIGPSQSNVYFIFNLSVNPNAGFFINFTSTDLSYATSIYVDTVKNRLWVPINNYFYSGSDYLKIPIQNNQNNIIGIFMQVPANITNITKNLSLNATNTTTISNITTTIPATVTNITNTTTISNISNISSIQTTIPATVTNITNTTIVYPVHKNNSHLVIVIIIILIIAIAIIIYYYYKIRKNKNNNRESPPKF